MSDDHSPQPTSWCPKSGQLLGAVVAAFRLDDPAVGGVEPARHLARSIRHTKDYFAGEWVGDERRQEVCGWVADALLNSGLIAGLRFARTEDGSETPVAPILAATIHAWLRWWDAEFHVAADRWPGADRALSAVALARPVVVDLALRWTSVLVLSGRSAPESSPRWCEQGGGARILRAAIDEYAPERTMDEHTKAFAVDRRTLDRWLSQRDPLVPSEGSIARVADVLSHGSGASANDIRVRLRGEYGMFIILRDLAAITGWRWATELGVGLVRLIRLTIEDFGDEDPTRHYLENLSLSVMNGSWFPLNADVLDEWLVRDLGAFWVDDVRAARDRRIGERLTQCLRVVGPWGVDGPPRLPDDSGRTPEERRGVLESIAILAMRDNRATPERIARAAEQGHVFYRIPARDDAHVSSSGVKAVELQGGFGVELALG